MNYVPTAETQFNGRKQLNQKKVRFLNTLAIPKFIKKEYLKLFLSFKTVNVVILLALVYIVYLLYNPPFLAEQNRNLRLIDKIEKVTDVPQGQTPVIAQIADIEALKSENQYQAEIYANAKNEDYVFGYGNRMVIFRENKNQIIYDGPVPQAKIEEEIIQNIIKAAASNSINLDASMVVQLSVVNDPEELKSNNPFYDAAQTGDIIAIYPEEQLILLYRPSGSNIVNSGNLTIGIN